jgi:hypothetical protein
MEEKQQIDDIQTHLQITIPIEGNYRTDKYNFKFGSSIKIKLLFFFGA